MLDLLWALLVTLIYGIASVTLGARLLRVILPRWDTAAPKHIVAAFGTAFLLGQGALANIWLLIGLAGWFYVPVVTAIIAAALLIGIRPAWPLLRGMTGKVRHGLVWLWQETLPWKLLAGGVSIIILGVFLRTLWGELNVDAAKFYMAMPRFMAATHRLILLPAAGDELPQAGLQGEMHFAVFHLFGLYTMSKLAAFLNGLAIPLMILPIGQKGRLNRQAVWAMLLMIWTSTVFTSLIAVGKVDLFAASMTLTAVYWSLESMACQQNKQPYRHLLLIGLFAGLAAIAKLSYIVPLAPTLLVLVIWGYALRETAFFSRAALTRLLTGLLWIGAWAGLLFLPHFLKNAILYQEPLLPFIGESNNLAQVDWYSPEMVRYAGIAYPFVQTLGQYQMGNISPLLLAFSPLILLLPRPQSWARSSLFQISVAALIGLGVALLLMPEVYTHRTRYALGNLLLFFPASALAVTQFFQAEKRRWLHAAAFISTLVTLLIVMNSFQFIWYFAERETICLFTGCDIRIESLMWIAYTPSEVLNEIAEPGERIYFRASHAYWLRSDLMACTNDRLAIFSGEPEARWEQIYTHGFHYAVFDLRYPEYFRWPDPEQTPDWLTLTPLYDEYPYVVYRLDSTEPDRFATDAHCEEVQPGLWQVIEEDGR